MKNAELTPAQKEVLLSLLEQGIQDHIEFSFDEVGSEMILSPELTNEIIDTSYKIIFGDFYSHEVLSLIPLDYVGQPYTEIFDLWENFYKSDFTQAQLQRFTQRNFLVEALYRGYITTIALHK